MYIYVCVYLYVYMYLYAYMYLYVYIIPRWNSLSLSKQTPGSRCGRL